MSRPDRNSAVAAGRRLATAMASLALAGGAAVALGGPAQAHAQAHQALSDHPTTLSSPEVRVPGPLGGLSKNHNETVLTRD
ncbi:hypothetical protein ACFVGY_15700 [Streptomyces sp. NPDC127106]|uniref:hypothetical protein n=1 Tax=Streptomyces sp. NPDC127106 TaxID=3345360 RepID=UPI003644A03A